MLTFAPNCILVCRAQTPECGAFTWSEYNASGQQEGTCYLKLDCSATKASSTCVAGKVAVNPPGPPPPPGPTPPPANGTTFAVGRGTYNVKGYTCGDKSEHTDIFFPKQITTATATRGGDHNNQTFHVVVYGHGIGGGIDGCDDWLTTVSSLGLIVIAPFTSGGACPLEYTDM